MENIEDVEKNVDNVFSNLKIYQLPTELALILSLSIFELHVSNIEAKALDRYSAENAIVMRKSGLQILVENIIKRCLPLSIDLSGIEVKKDDMVSAGAALQFCQRYDMVSLLYWNYYNKLFIGSVNNRIVEFKYHEGLDIGRSTLNLLLHRYNESQNLTKSMDKSNFIPIRSAVKYSEATTIAIELIKKYEIEEIMDQMPDEIYALEKEIFKLQEKPRLDENTNYKGYSIGEYYRFWIEFSTLMAVYRFLCDKKSKLDNTFDRSSSRYILMCSLPKLLKWIINKASLREETVKLIIMDLMLDTESTHPDVLIQPLIPLKKQSMVLISPTIVTTTNWETCLLRNWGRSPDIYGNVVGGKKGKLADQLGNKFNHDYFVVSTRKKILGDNNKEIGDVDVAVFDKREGTIVIFEVKWLIEPDSPKETNKTHKEINTGIKQVLQNKREYLREPANFLKHVFPQYRIESTEVKELLGFVVGHGDVGPKDDIQNEIFVLDYLVLSEIIDGSKNLNLKELMKEVTNKHRKIEEIALKQAGTIRLKLAGYLFSAPGFGNFQAAESQGMKYQEKIKRNDLCSCGSGLKYKKCCLAVESLSQNAVF